MSGVSVGSGTLGILFLLGGYFFLAEFCLLC